jgi:hypothetical protein
MGLYPSNLLAVALRWLATRSRQVLANIDKFKCFLIQAH